MRTEDGKLNFFYVTSNSFFITTLVEEPAFNDTLAWLKLTLKEASAYLNSNGYRVLDSCIRGRSYNFKSNERSSVKLLINSSHLKDRDLYISGESYDSDYGNFHLVLMNGKLTER